VLPLLYVLGFLLVKPFRLWFVARGWSSMGADVSPGLLVAMALHGVMLVWTGALVVVHAIHLAATDRVPEGQRLAWLVLLLVAGVLVLPVYWYLYVWDEPRERRLRPRQE
jgi:apolipoprotein N-acyltransferase